MPPIVPLSTAFAVAHRFIGMREFAGVAHNPAIVAMLNRVDPSVLNDETPWCSAFVNHVTFLLGLPRSGSLAARSWLMVGEPVTLDRALPAYDVVILTRGPQAPAANVIAAPGHVGFFAEWKPDRNVVRVLGGNQGDKVSIADFDAARVLGVRRLI